jgi:TonB family protein
VRSCLAALYALVLILTTAESLWAAKAPPIGSHIPASDRPPGMPARVWLEVFAGTTPSGKQLSALELKPLVVSAVWPPSFPTRVGWHLQIGVFLLGVKPDGTVSSVGILQSTGQGFIDRGVVRAFARWRFRPGSVKEVRIPAYYIIERS